MFTIRKIISKIGLFHDRSRIHSGPKEVKDSGNTLGHAYGNLPDALVVLPNGMQFSMRDRSRLINGVDSSKKKTTPQKIQKLLEAAQNGNMEIKPGDTILDNGQPSQAQKNEAALAIQDAQITVSVFQELMKKVAKK